jgi:hypothetical protein
VPTLASSGGVVALQQQRHDHGLWVVGVQRIVELVLSDAVREGALPQLAEPHAVQLRPQPGRLRRRWVRDAAGEQLLVGPLEDLQRLQVGLLAAVHRLRLRRFQLLLHQRLRLRPGLRLRPRPREVLLLQWRAEPGEELFTLLRALQPPRAAAGADGLDLGLHRDALGAHLLRVPRALTVRAVLLEQRQHLAAAVVLPLLLPGAQQHQLLLELPLPGQAPRAEVLGAWRRGPARDIVLRAQPT